LQKFLQTAAADSASNADRNAPIRARQKRALHAFLTAAPVALIGQLCRALIGVFRSAFDAESAAAVLRIDGCWQPMFTLLE